MKTLRALVALLCVVTLVHPAFAADQAQEPQPAPTWVLQKREDAGGLKAIVAPYQQREAPPVNYANSNRLEALLRAGNLYLSLSDAIALALENNLDVELSRYRAPTAEADILRAKSGSLLQGIDTSITQGAAGVGAGAAAGAQLVGGGAGAGAGAAGGGGAQQQQTTVGGTFGGLQIQQIGANVPNYDPLIQFNTNWFHRTRPLTSRFVTGTTFLVQETSAANFQIQQGLATGGQVTFAWDNSYLKENTPYDRNQLNPARTGAFRLIFSQPLLQGWGLALNRRFLTIANNTRRVADIVFERQVIETVSAVIRLYWDLVSLREEVKVQQQAVELAQKLLSDNRKQVEIGTLAPIEIVRAESELASAQQRLINAETQVLQQEIVIKNALSRTGLASPAVATARIVPTDVIRVAEEAPMPQVEPLVQMANQKRPELRETRLSLENSHLQMMGNKSALRPQLSAFAFAQNNGLAGQINEITGTIPPELVTPPDPFFLGGFGRTMEQIFRRNFPDYGVGVQLQIPLRNRNAQGNMIQSQLTLRQQEIRLRQLENQIRSDFENAIIGLRQAQARYQAAAKSRVLSEQTLDAEQKKYALGASTIFLVIQAQRDLAAARSTEVASQSSYANAQVGFYRATGQVLDQYNIALKEAYQGQISRAPSPLPPEEAKP